LVAVEQVAQRELMEILVTTLFLTLSQLMEEVLGVVRVQTEEREVQEEVVGLMELLIQVELVAKVMMEVMVLVVLLEVEVEEELRLLVEILVLGLTLLTVMVVQEATEQQIVLAALLLPTQVEEVEQVMIS
jgi:hypothetical protein